MTLWWLLIGALTIQEGVSTTVLLLEAHQKHYSIFLITLIWLVVTVLQIYAGFYLGKWIQKRFSGTKFEAWLKKSQQSFEKYIGKTGESFGLILVSGLVSPAVAALGASWLDISFMQVFIFALLGDFLWYLSEWITVLGLTQLVAGAHVETIIVIIGFVAVAAFFAFAKKAK
jgi:hypothetical protein